MTKIVFCLVNTVLYFVSSIKSRMSKVVFCLVNIVFYVFDSIIYVGIKF
jgi:hypothetical protein